MSLFYILLALSLVWMELSNKFDTENLAEKIGAGIMFTGSLISLVTVNHLIPIGASIYFGAKMVDGYLHKNDRREDDKSV